MEQHNDEGRVSHQNSKRKDAINGRLPHQMVDHDAQEDFYTRLGAHDGTPPLPSHLGSAANRSSGTRSCPHTPRAMCAYAL
ncbi:hypothetical protein [Absidia glauca]|uniref:Uncharacterized protein n=1 Tax=Absidia glauca TaxID=4829 RepID=A0A163KCJ6_ABSGL|nr:hypothetical protein [Absidia glauca]